MNDSLRDFVNKNRDAFDDQEPAGKIWVWISNSLPRMKERNLWNSVVVWRLAAALFLGLSVYLFSSRETTAPIHRDLSKMSGDFSDLESFYQNEIAEKARLINDFDAIGEGDQVTQDYQKLDAMYEVLSEEMKSHPTEKVKDALILNLLVRVDLLNQQLKKLEESREKKREANASEV
jgi:hypothetical protein